MWKSGKIMFQIERTASARALSGEHVWYTGGTARRSAWLEHSRDAVKEVKGKCKSHRGPITHVKIWLEL